MRGLLTNDLFKGAILISPISHKSDKFDIFYFRLCLIQKSTAHLDLTYQVPFLLVSPLVEWNNNRVNIQNLLYLMGLDSGFRLLLNSSNNNQPFFIPIF